METQAQEFGAEAASEPIPLPDETGEGTALEAAPSSLWQLPASSGLFDRLSLSATYSCTRQQMDEAYRSLGGSSGADVQEPIKTMYHETAHLYQALTPYGIYLSLLQRFQTRQITRIVHLIKHEYKLPLKTPLGRYVQTLKPREKYPEVWRCLTFWSIAQLLVKYFEGEDTSFYKDLFENEFVHQGPFQQGAPMLAYIAEMDNLLRQDLQHQGLDFSYSGPGLNVSDIKKLYAQDRQQMAIGMSMGVSDGNQGFSANVRDLLESGATAFEYWGQGDRASLQNIFAQKISSAYGVKYSMLHNLVKDIKVDSVDQYVVTFAALVEIALFSPLLPYYSELRHERMSLKDIHPLQRFIQLTMALSQVRPLDGFEDYARFTQDLCDALEWPTPTAIAARTLEVFPQQPVDPLDRLYWESMQFRIRIPQAFVDMNVWHRKDHLSLLFRTLFVHPVIEHSDKTLFHKDKDLLLNFATNYVCHNYFQKLITSKDLTVTLPYRSPPDHIADVTQALTFFLEDQLALNNPQVNIRSM